MSEVAKHKVRHMTSQFLILVAIVFGTILVFSLAYWGVEAYSFYQCVEWAIQTITSVGYGNYTATTVAGSILADVLMLWGVFILLGVVTAVIVNALREDPNVFTDEEQKKIMQQLDRNEEEIAELKGMIQQLLERSND